MKFFPRNRLLVALALSWGALVAASSCDRRPAGPPSVVVARSAKVLHGRPGAALGPLRVQVLGAPIRGVIGRAGKRDPIPGAEVKFEFKGWKSKARAQATESASSRGGMATVSEPPSPPRLVLDADPAAPPGAQLLNGGDEATVIADELGMASISVKLGYFVGDFRVRAEIRNENRQRRWVEFLIFSGAEVLDGGREAKPGATLPVTVRVWRVERLESGAAGIGAESGGAPSKADADRDEDLGAKPEDPEDPEESDDDGSDEDDRDAHEAEDRRAGYRVLPEKGREVLFTIIEGERAGSSLDEADDKTNLSGIATLGLTLGKRVGRYRVLAELDPKADSPVTRGLVIEHYAVDRWRIALSLLGGVALFAVGLRLLASGLLIELSPYLPLVTGKFTRNRLYAFFGGAAGGLSFQSSYAVSSHLIAFANGGLLVAAAASGQVLGAHAGKTVLLQLLAFESIPTLTTPILAIGAFLLVLPARYGTRSWAGVLVGVGLVLLGWSFLTECADLVALSPRLSEAIAFWDPGASDGLIGSVASALLVAALALLAVSVLRSTNIAVAVAMAFAAQGLVSFTFVIPVILGANLGSAFSAWLSALRRNREAKLLALTQVFQQLMGAAWLVLFSVLPVDGVPLCAWLVDAATPGELFHPTPENVAHHVAMLYSLFHVINGVICLSASPWLQRVAERIVSRDPVSDDLKPFRLDAHLIGVPALAITQATREVCYLGELVRKAVAESFDAFRYLDLNLTDQIARREESVNTIHTMVTQYLLRVSENNLSQRDAGRLESLQAGASAFSQIGETSEQFCHLTTRILEEKLDVPEDILRELTDLYELVMSQFENVLHLLERPDPRVEENALKTGERITKAGSRIENLWLQKLREYEEGPAVGDERTTFVVLVTQQAYDTLERIARHLTHIAERIRILDAR